MTEKQTGCPMSREELKQTVAGEMASLCSVCAKTRDPVADPQKTLCLWVGWPMAKVCGFTPDPLP